MTYTNTKTSGLYFKIYRLQGLKTLWFVDLSIDERSINLFNWKIQFQLPMLVDGIDKAHYYLNNLP